MSVHIELQNSLRSVRWRFFAWGQNLFLKSHVVGVLGVVVPVTGVQALDPERQRRGTVIARWKLIDNLGGRRT